MSKLYRIKPLKWEEVCSNLYRSIPNIFRGFTTVPTGICVMNWPRTKQEQWCYQIGNMNCVGSFKTAESAMKAAEKAYIKQLQQVLEEVST
jgi:hypothetical protein